VRFTKSEAINFIEKCFGDASLSNSGLNANVLCPVCRSKNGSEYTKKKLAIRTTDFATHCWVCAYKSRNILNLLYRFKRSAIDEYRSNFYEQKFDKQLNISDLDKEATHRILEQFSVTKKNTEKAKVTEAVLPKNFVLLSELPKSKKHSVAHLKAMEYLTKQRMLSYEQIVRFNLGIVYWFDTWDDRRRFENRIIIPSVNEDGIVDFFTTRSIIKDVYPRYTNSGKSNDVVFNRFFIDPSVKELTLVEGPFDYFCSPYENTIPLLGSDFGHGSELYKFIFQFKPQKIRLVLDKNETAKTNNVAKVSDIASGNNTVIVVGSITHDKAKDFAEIQELGDNALEYVAESQWKASTLTERILEKFQ
jgi:hypothetical protein